MQEEKKQITFSQFAQVLYPYCKECGTEADFVIELTNRIMHGQPGRAHPDGTYQNPMLSKEERSLQYYFSGGRSIPKKDARRTLSSIDKKKFAEYIERCCSVDAQISIIEKLSKIEDFPKNQLAPYICADLFEQILDDIATK